MKKARTRDELFMICLYELALEKGAIDTPIDRYEVGKRSNLAALATDTISKLLLQANFIKKGEADQVFLTKHGESLVYRLLEE